MTEYCHLKQHCLFSHIPLGGTLVGFLISPEQLPRLLQYGSHFSAVSPVLYNSQKPTLCLQLEPPLSSSFSQLQANSHTILPSPFLLSSSLQQGERKRADGVHRAREVLDDAFEKWPWFLPNAVKFLRISNLSVASDRWPSPSFHQPRQSHSFLPQPHAQMILGFGRQGTRLLVPLFKQLGYCVNQSSHTQVITLRFNTLTPTLRTQQLPRCIPTLLQTYIKHKSHANFESPSPSLRSHQSKKRLPFACGKEEHAFCSLWRPLGCVQLFTCVPSTNERTQKPRGGIYPLQSPLNGSGSDFCYRVRQKQMVSIVLGHQQNLSGSPLISLVAQQLSLGCVQ